MSHRLRYVEPGAQRRCWRCSDPIPSGRYCAWKGCAPKRNHGGSGSKGAELRATIDKAVGQLVRQGVLSVGAWRPSK